MIRFTSLRVRKKIDHRLCIFAMLPHPQGEGLETLDDEEGVEWRKRSTDVAQ
jgi:hypothetical protein